MESNHHMVDDGRRHMGVYSFHYTLCSMHNNFHIGSISEEGVLHSDLSPYVTIPTTLLSHFGGLIPGLVVSDKT